MKVVKVGRSSGNDIVIQNDGYVGRTHCEFIQDDSGNYWVVDMNSKNGTFVNGVRRSGKTKLSSNDMVRIGNTMLPWRNYFTGVSGGNTDVGTQVGSGNDGGWNPPVVPPSKPNNYLALAILSTIFCCLPFGIVSIVFASKVDNLWNIGDYNGAMEAARKAKTWFWLSFGLGLVLDIIILIYYIAIIGVAFLS